MKFVDQTRFEEDHNGNCFSACVASYLGKSIKRIPDWNKRCGKNWYRSFVEWAAAHGLGTVWIAIENQSTHPIIHSAWVIAIWGIKDSPVDHAVLSLCLSTKDWGYRFIQEHDPNPHKPERTVLRGIIILQGEYKSSLK